AEGLISYEWSFGDSKTSETIEPSEFHTYTDSGTFTIEVCAIAESTDSVCSSNTIVISEVPVEILETNNTDVDDSNSDDVSQKGTDAASGGIEISTNTLVGLGVLSCIILVIGILIGRGRNGPPPLSLPSSGEYIPPVPPPQMNRYDAQPTQQIPRFDPGILK
ncbi:MAG TPA: PKD domain-containing protein, partial [Candidatus Poseidoniaceae archaeon]|nr:PKD domain-containing protein [Candidatus Poseidoniaceae archaeon]